MLKDVPPEMVELQASVLRIPLTEMRNMADGMESHYVVFSVEDGLTEDC